MATNTIGINEDKIDDMIIEFSNQEDQLCEIFNNMEAAVTDAMLGYKCQAANLFSQKFFDNIEKKFSQIKSNMETYRTDLIMAKDSSAKLKEIVCQEFEKSISEMVNNANYNKSGGV